MPTTSSTSSSTFQTSSFSSTSTTLNGQTTSRSQTTHSDPSGTRIQRSEQLPGQSAPNKESIEYDSTGRRVEQAGGKGRIEDVTDQDEQRERDMEYEERMEGEYAKREGGA